MVASPPRSTALGDLVVAVRELRWVGFAWTAMGAAVMAAAVRADRLDALTGVEVIASGALLILSVGSALGGLVLGRRSGPASRYWQIFSVARQPPPWLTVEDGRRTAARAVAAALLGVLGMGLAALVAVAGTFTFAGLPRSQVLDHAPHAAPLVAAGWSLTSGLVTLRVAAWFERWERRNRRVILCHALRSGMMLHVYYAADEAAGDPGAAARYAAL